MTLSTILILGLAVLLLLNLMVQTALDKKITKASVDKKSQNGGEY